MSTPIPKAPKIDFCEALNLAHGYVHGDRYYGKVNDRLGVCVYTAGKFENYFAQMFPIPGPAADLHMCFVSFSLAIAKNGDAKSLRAQYRYITAAEDVLTLKCLIHEAEDRWREYNEQMEAGDAGRQAGEGVE